MLTFVLAILAIVVLGIAALDYRRGHMVRSAIGGFIGIMLLNALARVSIDWWGPS